MRFDPAKLQYSCPRLGTVIASDGGKRYLELVKNLSFIDLYVISYLSKCNSSMPSKLMNLSKSCSHKERKFLVTPDLWLVIKHPRQSGICFTISGSHALLHRCPFSQLYSLLASRIGLSTQCNKRSCIRLLFPFLHFKESTSLIWSPSLKQSGHNSSFTPQFLKIAGNWFNASIKMYGKAKVRASESSQLFDSVARCISITDDYRRVAVVAISRLASSQACFKIFFVSSSIS